MVAVAEEAVRRDAEDKAAYSKITKVWAPKALARGIGAIAAWTAVTLPQIEEMKNAPDPIL